MNNAEKTNWREKLQKFQVENQIPWWKFSYAESLLNKAFDFFDVNQDQLGLQVLNRLESWMHSHQKSVQEQDDSPQEWAPFSGLWSQELLEEQLQILEGKISAYQALIPKVELEGFRHRLGQLQLVNQSGELELSDIRNLRVQLIDRVRQSLGTMGDLKFLKEKVKNELHVETIGPYNNKYNFTEAFNILSSSDPIWAGDFLELYNSLFGLEDKVASSVLKRK